MLSFICIGDGCRDATGPKLKYLHAPPTRRRVVDEETADRGRTAGPALGAARRRGCGPPRLPEGGGGARRHGRRGLQRAARRRGPKAQARREAGPRPDASVRRWGVVEGRRNGCRRTQGPMLTTRI